MATVTLLQPTNMAALPILTGQYLRSDGDEIDLTGTNGYVYRAVALTDLFPESTISRVVIDDADYGNFPNLDIAGLSFNFNFNTYYFSVIQTNLPQFVRDLLSGDDTITGSSGADTILGYLGNDTLIGGAGGDVLNGGGANDTASYATAPAGLFAGLDEGGSLSDAAGDSYIGVENLIGSAFNDILYGNDFANILTGGTGNDQMVGKGGADRFDGGIGNDTVFYDASFPYTANLAIRADLLSPTTNTGDAQGDIYISIENLEGSSFDDVLAGNNGPNILRGNH